MEIKAAGPWLGLYLPDNLHSAPHKALEYQLVLEKNIQILSFYTAWGPGNGRPDLAGINKVIQCGFVPIITWEPWWPEKLSDEKRPEDQPEYSLSAILSGKYDGYIWNWALDLKKVQSPIFFRPMHEMNGNWYPWCGKVNGNTPEKYIETWRYIRSIFREAQNDRLIWVWSPYAHSVPEEAGNEIGQYFPGGEEVDWVGLDGYNWGTSREWSSWQSFREIFQNGYNRLIQLAPDKSFMIAEMGCAEEDGDKSVWIKEAFETLKDRFCRTKALVWFNVNKECDWRIESSQHSVFSFKKNWVPFTNEPS